MPPAPHVCKRCCAYGLEIILSRHIITLSSPASMKWCAEGRRMNKRTDKAKAACVIGFALALGGLVSACGSPQPKESLVPPKPLTAEERVRWYQTCWNDFNEKKWDDFKTCYAPVATSQQPGQGKPYLTGPAEIVAAWQDFEKSFPDIRGEGQLILINGNHIAGISLL